VTRTIDQVVLKIAAHCNLNCHYCYIYNHGDASWQARPQFISDEIFDGAMIIIREYCERRNDHQIALLFHGGEPTLIGVERFKALAIRARTLLGSALNSLGVQTNATLITREWIEAFKECEVQVGVSLDGPPEIHDAVRVNHGGRGSYSATVRGVDQLREAGLSPGILSVVNPGASGLAAYRHFRSLGLDAVNFLLPDVSHDNKECLYGKFGPTPVADFLIPLFDAWFSEDDPDIVVSPFWWLLTAMMGGDGGCDMFGNPLQSYVVIETDGAIEPLDALRVCANGITKSGLCVLTHGLDDLHKGAPLLHRVVHEGVPLCKQCLECPEGQVCGGGYLPHRYSRAREFDNPSVWCKDILKLFGHIRTRAGLGLHD
jgi:uncharacterized protein